MKSKKTNQGFTLNDLSKIKPPPKPDFGNDFVGQIAAYMYDHRETAGFERSMLKRIRRSNKEIGNARKKTQKAWEKMVPSLIADRNLLDILRSKNLIEPFLEITEIIAEGHKRIPDDGRPAFEPHILSAIWAADKFFPDWQSEPSRTLARTLNDVLQRAGFDGGDKTESIRVALNNERKIRSSASKVRALNWKPPEL